MRALLGAEAEERDDRRRGAERVGDRGAALDRHRGHDLAGVLGDDDGAGRRTALGVEAGEAEEVDGVVVRGGAELQLAALAARAPEREE